MDDLNGKSGKAYLDETHICEEVPGVPETDKYFLWHEHKVAMKSSSKQWLENWAKGNGITVEAFYPFEP